MEKVTIWHLADNDGAEKLVRNISLLGLNVKSITEQEYQKLVVPDDTINLFIIDLLNRDTSGVLSGIRRDRSMANVVKFVIMKKRQIRDALASSPDLLHVEFISRPVNKREFILLLEKTIIVECYRELMRVHNREADGRIEAFESLLNIQRSDRFESEEEKLAFQKILEYEKHLKQEQLRLNRGMKEFSFLRQRELFDMKDRIKAEEMLSDLRRRELMDAQNVIKAQEEVIEFSSRELNEANRIIDAAEKAAELGRLEAIALHEQLKAEKEKNKVLMDEIMHLKVELTHQHNKT